jgi:hypothetical protein
MATKSWSAARSASSVKGGFGRHDAVTGLGGERPGNTGELTLGDKHSTASRYGRSHQPDQR